MMPPKFKKPENLELGNFLDAQQHGVRFAKSIPDGDVKATIVINEGFRESIEKYHEVISELNAQGYAVWMMDWVGQGGSERLIPEEPQKMHGQEYSRHVAAMHQFVTDIVKHDPKKPFLLLGHSMGGHISLRYLAEHPGVFTAAALSAPMFDINTAPVPEKLSRTIALFGHLAGAGKKYVPAGHDWTPLDEVFEGNLLSSDPTRQAVRGEIFKSGVIEPMGSPTLDWLFNTYVSIDVLNNPAYLKRIQTPLLIGLPGDDKVVRNDVAENSIKSLPHVKVLRVPFAKHELWMERDQLRKEWIAAVDAFIQPASAPAPKPAKPGLK